MDVVTDESRNVIDRYSYDAWGKRRPANDWSLIPSPGVYLTATLNRGYTGHEMLDHRKRSGIDVVAIPADLCTGFQYEA